ncbi:sulfatase [Pseudorhodobacter sp. W20_MBD10_FR17]|uniref:sulfatase n=1 Tax=Pseudorhodobacter sp. W20_MBD10_FR17 TaxID=3240266 RepID=UPI003F9A972B
MRLYSPKPMIALICAAVVLNLALVMPNRPSDLLFANALRIAFELPAILLALMAVRERSPHARLLRGGIVALILTMVLFKLADIGTYIAFARLFNLAVDLFFVGAGFDLGLRTLGLPLMGVALLLAAGGLVVLAWALWWAAGRWTGLMPRGLPARLSGVAAALCVIGIAVQTANYMPVRLPVHAATTQLAKDHILVYFATVEDIKRFRTAAAIDPFAGQTALFDRLNGRDVLIVFIESYGRASFENPLYAPTHTATLRKAEPAIAAAGLAMRSGWLTSPVEGGQSWLAHSTLESGLTISNQTKYRAMLASDRLTLYDLAAASGRRTAAIMPGITMAWPEGPMQGFQTIFAEADLNYKGQPFNFVTMPDQYTLTAFDRLIPRGPQAGPLFAQIVLLSSHAPWVPVPEMVDWAAVGDGTIFDTWATSGDPPNVVWRDKDRVRDQYRQALDYSLQAITSYAARPPEQAPLMIILGDHQAAPFVAQNDSKDVPIHMIGPPDVIALFDDWGWADGLIPGAGTPVWPMQDFRDNFVRTLSSTGPAK